MDDLSDYVAGLVASASNAELAAVEAEYLEWLSDRDEHHSHDPAVCFCRLSNGVIPSDR